MKYHTFTLPNGLRIIHRPTPSEVVYCGLCIAAGSRHELPEESGMAHYCEHLSFKGTERRHSRDIINGLERLGGDLNAFTTKEHTTYYAALLKHDISTAIDLLCDMVFHSTYPEKELEKELEVIVDEYNCYEETPPERIYDDFEERLFAGHPLGRNIFGDLEALRHCHSEDVLRFARRHYRPEKMVFFVDGDVDFEAVVSELERCTPAPGTGNEAAAHARIAPDRLEAPFHVSMEQEGLIHQCHQIMGNRAYGMGDPKRMALYLMNNILGGPAMNARLNLQLREKYGLVYSVESGMVNYSDCGLWYVYYACGEEDAERCSELVMKEVERLRHQPLSQEELRAAQKQLKGQLAVAGDNRESFALDFAKTYLYHGKEKDLHQLFQTIDSIRSEELTEVANEIFVPERLSAMAMLPPSR